MSPSAEPSGAALVNLGCRVNRVELDLMAQELERAGVRLVGEAEADVVIVNTCAVTAAAEAKTRRVVRRAACLPQAPLVVATGCAASLFPNELTSLAPNVVVEADKGLVAGLVAARLEPLRAAGAPDLAADRPTPTGRTRPGVKIQDGCDNRCTYCIIWRARGRSRSVAPEKVISLVREACARGGREVVLTGINLGSYRARDERGRELDLASLIELLLERTDVGRLRLSSIEPPDVTEELCRVMAEGGARVAPFLHVCLQSGVDETLRHMGRPYDTSLFRSVVATAREALPDVALGTDLIVGFPGETDDEFESSLAFCAEMRFSRMHVFRYSRRPSTPAAALDAQVDPRTSAERARRARALARDLRLAEAEHLVGKDDLVLVEFGGCAVSGGLFDVELAAGVEPGSLVAVRLTKARPDATLVGVLR